VHSPKQIVNIVEDLSGRGSSDITTRRETIAVYRSKGERVIGYFRIVGVLPLLGAITLVRVGRVLPGGECKGRRVIRLVGIVSFPSPSQAEIVEDFAVAEEHK
jgi:hypothetical protein